jgi:hypothetical protein|nr:hypothetical protein [Neorhizobium tomejilense]
MKINGGARLVYSVLLGSILALLLIFAFAEDGGNFMRNNDFLSGMIMLASDIGVWFLLGLIFRDLGNSR